MATVWRDLDPTARQQIVAEAINSGWALANGPLDYNDPAGEPIFYTGERLVYLDGSPAPLDVTLSGGAGGSWSDPDPISAEDVRAWLTIKWERLGGFLLLAAGVVLVAYVATRKG